MTKTLQDRIYLKSKFFAFKMIDTKSIKENLDEYNKLLINHENTVITIEDEDKYIILVSDV